MTHHSLNEAEVRKFNVVIISTVRLYLEFLKIQCTKYDNQEETMFTWNSISFTDFAKKI